MKTDTKTAPDRTGKLPSGQALAARLVKRCAAARADAQAQLLRETASLLGIVLPVALVDAGAFESAALALIPADAGYMLSRGGDGRHLASVILPGMDEDITAEGATAALALLGALAGALLSTLPSAAPSAFVAGHALLN